MYTSKPITGLHLHVMGGSMRNQQITCFANKQISHAIKAIYRVEEPKRPTNIVFNWVLCHICVSEWIYTLHSSNFKKILAWSRCVIWKLSESRCLQIPFQTLSIVFHETMSCIFLITTEDHLFLLWSYSNNFSKWQWGTITQSWPWGSQIDKKSESTLAKKCIIQNILC